MKRCFADGFIKKKLGQCMAVVVSVLVILLATGMVPSVVFAQEQHKSVKFLHKKKVKRKTTLSRIKQKKQKLERQQAESQQQSVNSAQQSSAVSSGAVSEPDKGTVTGLPLPHFLSLRADDVNMRAGPGTRYPIIWIYHRRYMPVKVLREFDVWRLVEDVDGQKGWVQQAILSRERSFIITGSALSIMEDKMPTDESKAKPEARHTDSFVTTYVTDVQDVRPEQNVILRDAPQETARPVAILKPGTIGHIKECSVDINWCKVKTVSYTGWIPKTSFWGLLPQEAIQSH